MAEIWWIYLNDWRNLFRIPVAVLLIAALIVLPSVYDWVNVAAVWDPYSNTSGIKIAVASLDKGAELQGKSFRAFLSNPESFYAVYLCDQSAAGSGWGGLPEVVLRDALALLLFGVLALLLGLTLQKPLERFISKAAEQAEKSKLIS
ncbi:hypothetical protein NSQ75_08075 [Paenibacillus sp. FSL L8-0463]|uniref:YhgE/Pip domain-containing protein n=1 Tax=Paenibacillus sp. FSL L8-0463 TaxID=2954687 RepID=UPI003119BCB6